MMGRPPGSKNRPKVTVAVEDNEFMAIPPVVPKQTEREPEPESLQAFAVSIWNDEKYKASLRARAASGDLTTAESRLLVEAMTTTVKRKESAMSRWIKYTTREELKTLAKISALAIAREAGKPLSDDPARKTVNVNLIGQEIVTYS